MKVLVQRDLTIKYQQSMMGYLWSLVEPMAMAAIYWFVFGVLVGGRVSPGGPESYPLFLVSGLFAWLWVNSTITEATRALTSQAQMIKTVRVPREVYPIGRVLGRFIEYLAAFPVLLIFVVIFGGDVGWNTLLLIPALILQSALLIGFALLVAPLNVMMRDIERMTRLLNRVLFYSCPILYSLELVQKADSLPGWVMTLYELNPLVGVFQLHHAAWFSEVKLPPYMWITSAVGCFGMLLLGWWSFRRLEPSVLKEL
ncbi:MAG: ABC transporter permease [Micromonosporaceae bacterium]